MRGLYHRAMEIRKNSSDLLSNSPGQIRFDEASGISQEEQKEILQQIDEIAAKTKIKVTPHLFSIQANKSGITLPLLVNLLGIVILGGGIFLFWTLFRGTEKEIMREAAAITTGDRTVIQKIKEQAQEEIAQKDKLIVAAQGQLQDIVNQKKTLEENIQAEVKRSTEEYKKQLENNLEEEKARLLAQGVSENQIRATLTELQERMETEHTAKIQDIEARWKNSEEQLDRLKQEADARISLLETEKKQKEQQLEKEIAQKEAELTAQKTKAERELKNLEEQQNKQEIVNNQIIGLYQTVKADLKSQDYGAALSNLDKITLYINDPAIINLPNILKRRDVELFVISSLKDLIQRETTKEKIDSSGLLAQVELVTNIKETIYLADQAVREGDNSKAEKLYLEALQKIPEIGRSHKFLVDQIRNIENFRAEQVSQYLSTADAYFLKGDYNQTISNYAKVLEYLPQDSDVNKILKQIQTTGFQLQNRARIATESREALSLLQQGNLQVERNQYLQAISSYLNLAVKYPHSTQLDAALKGTRTALDNLNVQFQDQIKTLTAKEASKAADIERYQTEINRLQQAVEEKERALQDARIVQTELQKELEANQSALAEASKRVVPPQSPSDSEVTRQLKEIAASYEQLREDYLGYALKEDSVMESGGIDKLIQAKSYLDTFLASYTMEETFPGLWSRIKRYDRAFEQVGKDSAVQDIQDMLDDLESYGNLEEKSTYLDRQLEKYRDNRFMAVLIKSLKGLLTFR